MRLHNVIYKLKFEIIWYKKKKKKTREGWRELRLMRPVIIGVYTSIRGSVVHLV